MSSCLMCPSFLVGGNRMSRAANKKAVLIVAAVILSFYFVGRIFSGTTIDNNLENYANPAEKLLGAFFEEEAESEVIAEELNYEVKKESAFVVVGDIAKGEEVTESTESITPFPDESLLVSDMYDGRWIHENTELCTAGKGRDSETGAKLLTLVVSAPANVDARDAIRRSWATPAIKRRDMALAFLVGSSPNSELQDTVLAESAEHGDMIVSVMTDSYRNMTLKILAGLEWSQRNCPSATHVLKADDDVFVQLPRLAHFLKQMSRRQPALDVDGAQVNPIILGFVASGWHPGRLVGHKYYISPRQFPGDVLPDFVTGPSYVASSTAIQKLLPLAWDHPYLHLEDVFITGILAEEAGVPRRFVTQLRNNAVKTPVKFLSCTLARTISIHQVEPQEQIELFQMAKNPQCGGSVLKKSKKRL